MSRPKRLRLPIAGYHNPPIRFRVQKDGREELNASGGHLMITYKHFQEHTFPICGKELEDNTNNAVNEISNKLKELKLDLLVDKCQGLALRSNFHYTYKEGHEVGNPLKYLGVQLDSGLTSSMHIMSLHTKTYSLTNSRSSIDALKGHRTISKLVNGIKEKFRLSEGLVGLAWVKAHIGIPGNELADRFVKQASIDREIMNIRGLFWYPRLG
ncbi:hypothetical protein AVEN_263768-1 [Araneus ventricosus]|uniref:RNase H type-1 domain-containing protein n=1 Tax=Araneus ventricosus TaxID=182803 RepID=A0A4Y2ARX2_ARAVE|nr:hypothetical protein AVEN_263768-1 [Araneus ventricosus]